MTFYPPLTLNGYGIANQPILIEIKFKVKVMFDLVFNSLSPVLRIQTILHRILFSNIRIRIRILLESDLISKNFRIYYHFSSLQIFIHFKSETRFLLEHNFKHRILPYYIFSTKKVFSHNTSINNEFVECNELQTYFVLLAVFHILSEMTESSYLSYL